MLINLLFQGKKLFDNSTFFKFNIGRFLQRVTVFSSGVLRALVRISKKCDEKSKVCICFIFVYKQKTAVI